MNERVRKLRKELGLTLEKFGERLGVKKNTVSQWENGTNDISDHVFKSICREFDVSEEWLRDGTGEMFRLHDDETAALVYNLLMDSEDNEFYSSVLEVVRTYEQLKPESQQIIRDACKLLFVKNKENQNE